MSTEAGSRIDLARLGQSLRVSRVISGMTQQELAWACGCARRTVQRIEAGTVETSLLTLYKMCRVLDMPLDDTIRAALR